jgi:ribosomal protein S12 methylthiotransferase accessory factor
MNRMDINDESAMKMLLIVQPAISDRTGIIRGIFEVMGESDDPILFHVVSIGADTYPIFAQPKSEASGGAGLTQSIASAAAIGESIERYCLSYVDESEFIFSSYFDLERNDRLAVNPKQLALFSNKQYSQNSFAFKEFTKYSMVNWVWGFSLNQNKPILIPASLVYIPYPHKGRASGMKFKNEEDLVCHAISSGAACAITRKEAILKGLYEVIERDALMITWLNKISCPLMDLSSGKWINKIFQEKFLPSRLKFYVANITMDIDIPTMFAIIIDEKNDGLAVCVGAASNLDAETAALKALVEAAQSRPWLKSLNKAKVPIHENDFNKIQTFQDRVLLYSKLNSIKYLDFIIKSAKIQTFDHLAESQSDVDTSLNECLSILGKKNMDAQFVDLTTRDIKQLGLHVTKTLIPGLQDLNAQHKYRMLGGQRLYDVPKIMGYAHKNEEDLNLVPHPFP